VDTGFHEKTFHLYFKGISPHLWKWLPNVNQIPLGFRGLDPMRMMPSFRRLIGAEQDQVSYSGPEDTIIFAVGDIHGHAVALARLLDRMVEFAEARRELKTRFVFLGDYVDRGIEIADAINELLEFEQSFECVFLRGNHDQIMLDFLSAPKSVGATWVELGGMETLAGYGVKLGERKDRDWIALRDQLVDAMPDSHIRFLQRTILQHEEGDYLFVHAGVNPHRALDNQLDKDLLWIRDEFLQHSSPLAKMVVHGHTPSERPVRTSNRIGVDTGVYLTGVLTAVAIMGDDIRFISSDAPLSADG